MDIEIIVFLGGFLLLMSLGYFVGGVRERSHLRELEEREHAMSGILLSQRKNFPDAIPGRLPAKMLVAEVVISSDYLKTFLGGLRNIFGGELRSFRSLIDRARREAILRIQEQAQKEGYDAVCNIRLDTVDIGGADSRRKSQVIMSAMIVSGTAYQTQSR